MYYLAYQRADGVGSLRAQLRIGQRLGQVNDLGLVDFGDVGVNIGYIRPRNHFRYNSLEIPI